MNLECFLRTIDVIHLTALISSNGSASLLTTRDKKPAEILRGYSPKTVKLDISAYKLHKIPDFPEVLADLRRHIEDSVNDDLPQEANAFHLSNPILLPTDNSPLKWFQYTVTFYKINTDSE